MAKPGAGSWVGLSESAGGNEVVVTSAALPTGAATEATLAAIQTLIDQLATLAETQPVDTELPAAAALADNTANPTVPAVGSFGLVWDGAAWDRAAGNSLGDFVQGNVAAAAADTGNPVKIGGVYNATRPTYATGQRGNGEIDTRGSLRVILAQPDSGANFGGLVPADTQLNNSTGLTILGRGQLYNGATWDMWRGSVANGALVDVSRVAGTVATKETRAATPSQSSPAMSNVSASILASNANRLGATIYNEGTAAVLVKLGSTASTSSYSVNVASGGYYEVPFAYTGAIDGITASGTATLRVTELAA